MSLININDKLGINDRGMCGLRGEVIFGKNRRVEEFIDPITGRVNYRSKFDEILFRGTNIVPIGSYDYIFDKLFNIGLGEETTLRVGDLNEDAPLMKIGVNPLQYTYQNEIKDTPAGRINIPAQHFIQGFMIGDGGATEDNITALATDYKRRTLFHAIPFRMNTDGSVINPQKYYGISQDVSGIRSYYIKMFDLPAPHIVHSWVTDIADQFEVVDETVFSSTSTIPIETYIEIAISVNKDDVRGYFQSTGATPRVNEFGLIAGYLNTNVDPVDFDAIRLITHFTRPSFVMEPGDTLEALYRIYAR